jgi:hypothetical protein
MRCGIVSVELSGEAETSTYGELRQAVLDLHVTSMNGCQSSKGVSVGPVAERVSPVDWPLSRVACPLGQTPVNGVGALLAQQAVGAAKRSGTDESTASGQRRRVRALDARNIPQRELHGLRVSPP